MNIVKQDMAHSPRLPAPFPTTRIPEDQSSPNGLLAILRRRLRLILATVVLIVGAAIIGLLVTTPLYSASAVMALDEAVVRTVANDVDGAPVREIEQRQDYSVRVQLERIKSRPVARTVVAELELYNEPEFNGTSFTPLAAEEQAPAEAIADEVEAASEGETPAGADATSAEENATATDGDAVEGEEALAAAQTAEPDPLAQVPLEIVENTIDALLAKVDAEQVGDTNFIVITAESTSADLAKNIANAMVASYMENRTAELADTNQRLIADLSVRTEELSERLKQAERNVADFKRRNNIDSSFAANAAAAQIQGAAAAIAAAQGESAGASAAAATQRAAGSATSALLTNLRNQESALRSQLANLTTQYGARHPDVMKVTAELAQVEQAVATEEARAAANVQATASGANARAGQIASALGGLRSQARRQDLASPELASLEREVETSNSLYLGMLERVKELQIQGANPKPEAVPVTAALAPETPSFPKPRQTVAIALAAAIVFAVFLAMIVDSFDNRLRSGDQIRRITQLPSFAMIPERGTIPDQVDGATAAAIAPKSVFAEAFRDAFLEISSRTDPANSRVVLITSALPGEGKTTISLGVAMSALGQGMRAIVLDFDFRRRGLSRLVELATLDDGLDTYLMGECELDEAIAESEKVPGIDCLAVTGVPENPAALFEPAKLEALFAELRTRYDFIVIDTPPVMALRDAKVLAPYADASVMTARWGKSSPDTVRAVTSVLGDALIGSIITRVDYAKHARFAYGDSLQYYSQYSNYYNEDEDFSVGPVQRWWRGLRQRLSFT